MSDDLLESWRREETAPFTGWDFSHLHGRWEEDRPPWSYHALARQALQGADTAVDLGTGGGEQLSRIAEAFPPRMFATEGYPPNVDVARRRLAPLGVTVVPYGAADLVGGPLPLADGSLDVILDRHESYDAREVARVLSPGGRFVTQQVDGGSFADLLAIFGATPPVPEVKLERFVADAKRAGLAVQRAEQWWGVSTFRDVGALVYYLKAVPWELADFTVAAYEATLRALHRRIERDGALRFGIGRFVIAAHKEGEVDQG